MKIIDTYKQTKYNVTKKTGRTVNHIVIHYTGGCGSAKNNCIYFGGAKRNASADYFIDPDGTIYLFNGDIKNYYSWHCGDGGGKYGITNSKSIGIEVVNSGNEFKQDQKDALRELVQMLMKEFGVKSNNVVRHYDASRKICPKAYCGSNAKDKKWADLKNYILSDKNAENPKPSTSYRVKITAKVLNVRKGPGTTYPVTTTVKLGDVYTIIEDKNGWGRLKSGAGWISLKYASKV